MSKRLILPLLIAATVSACATKTKDLPPQPVSEAAPPPATPTAPADSGGMAAPEPVGNSNVPGSYADFVAQSGSDKILFEYDSYELDEEDRAVLGKQAEWLARYPALKVTIEGHADERGTREYNLALGDRRATAAKNFLAAQGVATSRLSVISYGKERPAVEGADEAALAQNRRAVTVIAGAR